MKKTNLLLIFLYFLLIVGYGTKPLYGNQDHQQWLTYTNNKYKYEIKYPQGYILLLTGPIWERDGRQLRIMVKNLQLEHGVDCSIRKNKTLAQIADETGAPNLEKLAKGPIETTSQFHNVTWSKIKINNVYVIRAEIRQKENRQLIAVEIIKSGVIFHLHFLPLRDPQEIEDIISTFSFY